MHGHACCFWSCGRNDRYRRNDFSRSVCTVREGDRVGNIEVQVCEYVAELYGFRSHPLLLEDKWMTMVCYIWMEGSQLITKPKYVRYSLVVERVFMCVRTYWDAQ